MSQQPLSVLRNRSQRVSYLALSVALLCVCSYIAIPLAIPFTMQTFALFFLLGLLGGRLGTLAIVCYLLLGLFGLPVFAQFLSGPSVLFGVTGGYLLGFVLMGLCFWLVTHLFGHSTRSMAAGMLLGLLLLYAFGSLWFMLVYLKGTGPITLWAVLGWCVFPYLIPDLLKLVLALFLLHRIGPVLRHFSP